MYNINRAKS